MKPSKTLQYIIQIICWGIVFFFPLFFLPKEAELVSKRYLGYVFVPISFMVIFYLNYFFLINRLLFRKHLVCFLLSNVALFVLLTFLLDYWHTFYFMEIMGEKQHSGGPPKAMILLRDGAMMALTAALSVAVKVTNNWYNTENERKELEKARTEA